MDGYKKKTGFMASGMMALLSCVLFFSCSKEVISVDNGNDSGHVCDNICFGITSDGNVQTRGNASGSEKGYTSERFVLRSQDSEDTLCVCTIVSDGIESSVSVQNQVITRGAPVTTENFDSFHVLAYWKKKDGTSVEMFYMDEDITKKGRSKTEAGQNLIGEQSVKTFQIDSYVIGYGMAVYCGFPVETGKENRTAQLDNFLKNLSRG